MIDIIIRDPFDTTKHDFAKETAARVGRAMLELGAASAVALLVGNVKLAAGCTAMAAAFAPLLVALRAPSSLTRSMAVATAGMMLERHAFFMFDMYGSPEVTP